MTERERIAALWAQIRPMLDHYPSNSGWAAVEEMDALLAQRASETGEAKMRPALDYGIHDRVNRGLESGCAASVDELADGRCHEPGHWRAPPLHAQRGSAAGADEEAAVRDALDEIESIARALGDRSIGASHLRHAAQALQSLTAEQAQALTLAQLGREGDWATLADCLNSCLRESHLPEIPPTVGSIKHGVLSLLYKLNRITAEQAQTRADLEAARARVGELETVHRQMQDAVSVHAAMRTQAEARMGKLREVSHKLANELSGVFGYAELAIRDALGNTNAQILHDRLEALQALLATPTEARRT